MKIQTVLQSFDVPNRNKRLYPLKVMREAINNFLELVKAGEAFGELGHPEEDRFSRSVTIHPRFVSHIVKEAWLEDNILKGVVVPTGPYKDSLIDLVKQGKIGFSARVYASNWSRNSQGYEEPSGKIQIICYDAVIIPSHKEAYVESIQTESYNPLLAAFKYNEIEDTIEIYNEYDVKVESCVCPINTKRLLKL